MLKFVAHSRSLKIIIYSTYNSFNTQLFRKSILDCAFNLMQIYCQNKEVSYENVCMSANNKQTGVASYDRTIFLLRCARAYFFV